MIKSNITLDDESDYVYACSAAETLLEEFIKVFDTAGDVTLTFKLSKRDQNKFVSIDKNSIENRFLY